MGSGQSSGGGSGGSFSIDPSGNISPTRSSSTSSNRRKSNNNKDEIENDRNLTTSQSVSSSDDTNTNGERSRQSSSSVATNVEALNMPQKKTGDSDLSLQEVDVVISRMKAKYKPNSIEMAGKSASVFEEVERNLINCYKTNKNQPLKCSNLSHEYQDYVRKQRAQLLKKSNINVPLLTAIMMFITCLLFHVATVQCYGVMSVDLGSEWMKVGLVAPSVPMDIVLNPQSQRKTAMAVAFTNGERYVGDSAIDVASKYPERTFTHFLDLVGKTIQDESVIKYKQRFPYADLVSHEPNSTSIILNHPQGLKFTPLELIAMMLQHAHDQVVNLLATNEPTNDVVITVPPFFNQIERRVIIDAANLVGLNVLRLTNVNSAFALSYGIFRHKDYQPESLHPDASSTNRTSVLFVDQGATHTSVTLADYHLIEQVNPTTGASTNETLPTITIRGQIYDRYLGGFDMQLRLRDHLAKEFAKSAGVDLDRIYKRGRSISKLLKESARVKRVLSANTEHLVRVENVIDDKDLRLPITRQEFEQLNEDLLTTRVINLLDKLFELPNCDRNSRLESVMIVGGNTRTPKIQQVLIDYFKIDNLGKSVNADEGAALAALYQAASLGRGFRVKRFVLEEFGDEKRRYDPAKVVSTTTVAPEITASGETESSSPTNETITTEALSSATATTTAQDPNAIYSQSELKHMGDKLSLLREQDFLRLQRLSLRNSLESLLSEGREKLSSENELIKDRRHEIEKTIYETYDWLEEGPMVERDNVTLLADKYTQIHDLIHPRPPTTVPPPPPSPSTDLDPSTLNWSNILNNETLSILDALNFSNPFASKPSANDETTPEPSDSNESVQDGDNKKQTTEENTSKVTPDSVSPGPEHTEL